ncbi:MAG: ferric reductase-like transmembrane domain-containing protein [Candidatus Micrarchaeota archaeon]|nr:ferric reductase-like transmembrane domain-containing protein [Candidatus Micrarchaeota archaeon]
MTLKDINMKLVKKARILIYVIAFLLVVATWLVYSKEGTMTTDMSNAFGYLAFSFLSLALIVTPIRVIWPKFELNTTFLMARRALGVSAFIFALFHSSIQFFVNFAGDINILSTYASANIFLLFGSISLTILFLLFITSTDYAVRKLGKTWFSLHKLVYLAYPVIILHAYKIGLDFLDGKIDLYSGSFLVIAAITILLEIIRICFSLSKPKITSSDSL